MSKALPGSSISRHAIQTRQVVSNVSLPIVAVIKTWHVHFARIRVSIWSVAFYLLWILARVVEVGIDWSLTFIQRVKTKLGSLSPNKLVQTLDYYDYAV